MGFEHPGSNLLNPRICRESIACKSLFEPRPPEGIHSVHPALRDEMRASDVATFKGDTRAEHAKEYQWVVETQEKYGMAMY